MLSNWCFIDSMFVAYFRVHYNNTDDNDHNNNTTSPSLLNLLQSQTKNFLNRMLFNDVYCVARQWRKMPPPADKKKIFTAHPSLRINSGTALSKCQKLQALGNF